MSKHGDLRINLFLVVVFLASSLILYRLFVLSIVRHSDYFRTAQAQSENISSVMARGNIYSSDKDGDIFLLATNKKFPLAYVIPSKVESGMKDKIAEKLVEILEVDPSLVEEKIDSDSENMKIIARRINTEQVNAIEAMDEKGLGIAYEIDRFYPNDSLVAHVVGFLGYNAEGVKSGQYGVEEYYNQELFGRKKELSGYSTYTNILDIPRVIKSFFSEKEEDSSKLPAEPDFDKPEDIVLTIDKNIQLFVEEELKKTVEKWSVEKGTVIVQESKTGRILAIANWPFFNPNSYSDFDPRNFLNIGVQEMYEPGSSFKPITMAAGIDLGKITPQTTYEDKGFVNAAEYTIRNFSEKTFGVQTMTQVLEKSINTGTMYVENTIGDDNFLNYIINMGFGQKTGIDLPGETNGDITNLYTGRKINYLTASFGQGIAVTPLQLVNGYSAIANGGKMMKPYVVDKRIKEGGIEVITRPEIVSIPISEKTAVKLQTMLTSVVDSGFDKARITGYDVAGKTGTAQIPDGEGGYSKDEYIHNFVGFLPSYDARFTVLIKIDRPQGITFASDSLSPVFKQIAEFLLNYYGVPPTRK